MTAPTTDGHLLRRGLSTMRALVARHPRPFVLAVLGASVFAVATVASSWALGRITDNVIVPAFEDDGVGAGAVAASLALVVFVGLLKAAAIVVRRVNATIAVARIQATLRTEVVRHYQAVPYSFHRRRPTGELLSHAGNDVDAATEALGPLPYASGVIVILVVSVVWMLLTDPWLALVGFLVFPTLVLCNLLYQRTIERPAEQVQAELGGVSAVAHESFDGALVVKALGAERLEGARFRRATEALRAAKVRVATLRATFEALLDALPALGILVLLPVGAWRVDQGAITTGTVVAFASLFQLLVFPLRLIGYVLGELPRAVVGYDRVRRVLAEPVDLGVRDAATAETARGARVAVEGLTFGYEPGQPMLDDVSFTVEPGRIVAIVGATGSGKSTVLLLLARLLDPTSGSIRIDGAVAMAFQEAFLFADSVAENVLLGWGTDGELGESSRLAGADGFVSRLPEGYQTVVGERGATLSG
ncbi:MAG: ABC transporter ATP-binding protein, partial [Acidimicrobiales bacterium]